MTEKKTFETKRDINNLKKAVSFLIDRERGSVVGAVESLSSDDFYIKVFRDLGKEQERKDIIKRGKGIDKVLKKLQANLKV